MGKGPRGQCSLNTKISSNKLWPEIHAKREKLPRLVWPSLFLHTTNFQFSIFILFDQLLVFTFGKLSFNQLSVFIFDKMARCNYPTNFLGLLNTLSKCKEDIETCASPLTGWADFFSRRNVLSIKVLLKVPTNSGTKRSSRRWMIVRKRPTTS